MKFLFTVGGSHSTVFSIAPLATAARSAGHEILVTADEPLLETATSIGLPVVPSPHPGMPAARLQALLELTRQWPADVVVGGLSHVPGILATHLQALYVRHYWDIGPLRPEPGIEPDLERLGLTGPPEADQADALLSDLSQSADPNAKGAFDLVPARDERGVTVTLRGLFKGERLSAEGTTIVGDTPQEFAAMMKSESARWSKFLGEAGISID